MPAEPHITQRPEQPYVAVTGRVTMSTFGAIVDRMPEVFAFLAAQGIAPAGPAFFKYNVIDMERELEIEVGAPIAAADAGSDAVTGLAGAPPEALHSGVLPAGRYATVTHVGHPDELVDATARLLDWANRQGLRWDMVDTPAGQRWTSRLELYHSDPKEEPDMAKWETELAFRLAD
jgi:effector-binding domain-containing protein